MKQFLCEVLFSCSLLGTGTPPVDELTYGTVLYEYFQEEHEAALLNALVAEAQDRRGENSVRFDLAAGSFAFADGMYSYASNIFDTIPEGELSELDSMRLAFHLAREFHRRQDWQPLAEQLSRIALGKTWLGRQRMHPEVEFMRGELAVQAGRFDAAEVHFGLMDEADPLRAYGLFNLGVAYRAAEQLPQAKHAFERLAGMPAYSDEAFDLGQRAKLALALIARQQQDTHSAETVLSALPAEGRYQEVAMAAYGGLAMDNQNYELAARIWMTLQQQDYWTPSTATARLGFPLSLEHMALEGSATTEMALMQFRAAETSFTERLDNLMELSIEAEDPQWVQGLLRVFAKDEKDPEQMRVLMRKWQDQLGHTDWLEWLATDSINQALTEWRELNGMEDWLSLLPEKLEALQGVAEEQARRGTEARQLLVGDGLLAKRTQMGVQLEDMGARLAAIESAQPMRNLDWMMPLATAEERQLLTDLDGMRNLLGYMNARDQVKWSARIGRLEGVMFYQLVDERAKRLQVLRKEHKQLADLLTDMDARIARVQGAEENFVAGVGTDFMIFLDRADDIAAMVNTARETRETLLANEIRGRMQQEMQQVQQYLLVTRIAIARATDQLAAVDGNGLGPLGVEQ